MNPTIVRSGVALLLLAAGWAIGFYAGSGNSPANLRYVQSSSSDRLSESLAKTAIGQLVSEKSEFRRQVNLHHYADSLPPTAVAGAVNEAMQLPLRYRNAALQVLFARWADLDPSAAAAYANLLPESAEPSKLRQLVVTAWAEKDFSAALTWVRSLEKGAARTESLTLLAGELAKRDPAEAMKLIEGTFSAWEARNAYGKIFKAWAGTDFAAAITAAREITDIHLRSGALRAALSQHAQTDPRVVLDLLRQLKERDLHWEIGTMAAKQWFERDFATAKEYVLALPAGDLRFVQMRQMAYAMAQTDPGGALAQIEQFPEKDRSSVACDILETWAYRDSASAAKAARALPEGELRDGAIGRIAQCLVRIDTSLAFALATEIPNGELREGILSSVASSAADSNPGVAAEWYFKNASGNERKSGIENILSKWGRSDAEAALRWAAGRGNISELGAVVTYLAREGAGDEPEKALSRVEQFPVDAQQAAIRGIAQRWGQTDAEAAVDWALQLKDEKVRTNAIGAIAGAWGDREPAAAAKWIESLPAGPDRDEAVSNFTQYTVNRDPEGAMAWAITIQDPSKQAKAMRETFESWLNRDTKAAGNWLQSTQTISAESRKALQTTFAQKAEN